MSPSTEEAHRLRLTEEQEAALERFLRGEDLKIIAVAGSGKTTTLRAMAEAAPGRRLYYLAFNRAIKEEARRKMPGNVRVLTLHGLAYRQVVAGNEAFLVKLRAGGGQVRAKHIYEALQEERVDRVEAYVIKATLEAFLRSEEEAPKAEMVPSTYRKLLRLKGEEDRLEAVLKWTARVWERVRDPEDPFPLSHDAYAKLWALSRPRLEGADALLVDEAQDLDPVFAGILTAYPGQKVFVGDPHQEIYGWRGAVNALDRLPGEALGLTWSFRFGEGLAAFVRAFMARLGRPVSLRGMAPWPTEVSEVAKLPAAVLTRTNAGLVAAFARLGVGERVHVLGGARDLVWLMADTEALRRGWERPNPHPDLVLLRSWRDLERLEEEAGEPTAQVLLALAREHSRLDLLGQAIAEAEVEEERASLVLSTAHRAKGREWDHVLLWEDFPAVWDPETREAYLKRGEERTLEEEENLLYVAFTRARRLLVPPGSFVPPEGGRKTAASPSRPDLLEEVGAFLGKLLARGDLPEDLRREALDLVSRLGR